MLFGPAKELYGVELHAFWLGALTFTNLEDYFATAYMNSSSTSSVFAQSQSDLMSTSFQISALNSTINSFVKQKTQEARNSQTTNYIANTTLRELITNMTANQSAMGTNARFFAVSIHLCSFATTPASCSYEHTNHEDIDPLGSGYDYILIGVHKNQQFITLHFRTMASFRLSFRW